MSNNQFCQNQVCYFFDPPFISALDKLKLSKVSCLYCDIIYCSESCRDQDWNKKHNQKCLNNPDKLLSEDISDLESSIQSNVTSQRVTFNQQSSQPKRNNNSSDDIQDRLLQDFEDVDQVIGQGAYGKVVLVKDIHNLHVYAMKIIQKGCLQGMTQQQLNREINIQKKLSHINILKLYYSFQDRDYVHLILENAEKGSIKQILDQQLNEDQVWDYFRQICLGINYLHSFNVIHRDLKPENILINAENIVKLCDFGWSTEVNNPSQKRDTICGTIDYMAPEMIVQTGGYGPKVDIWSLGIILYEFLNGQVPSKDGFSATSEGLKMVNKNISLEAQELLQGLLEIDPQKRLSIKDIFVNSWFKKMAQSQSKFDMQTISQELAYQKSPISDNTDYFNIDNELCDENLSVDQSVRGTNISMSCLDQYLQKAEFNGIDHMNIFNQLTRDLQKVENRIQKSDDIDAITKQNNNKKYDHPQKSVRVSRITNRNNQKQRDDQIKLENNQKSFIDKFTDIFTCVKREDKNF